MVFGWALAASGVCVGEVNGVGGVGAGVGVDDCALFWMLCAHLRIDGSFA